MQINDKIRLALGKAIDHYGNVYQLANAMGISHSTVLFWMNGKTNSINGTLWTKKIKTFLEPYMAEASEFRESPAVSYSAFSERHQPREKASVISSGDLMEWEPLLLPLVQLIRDHSGNSVKFTEPVGKDMFAFYVDESHQGYFPAGSCLLISGAAYPQENEVVLCKRRKDRALFIGRYKKNGNEISIEPLFGSGQLIVNDCQKNSGYFSWIFPVIEAKLAL